ncbi:hypothetical protein RclHR1_11020011 [Rhizophagus clarus]|uniref:Uncharacterized protein n=1 Tax=Rhizophagus clarus TaxID=94130 RepID=A0A2Z6Q4S7_9GLOM|nr:hypothetical protein RclHR1_11020011 [Rhizophagus clarus]
MVSCISLLWVIPLRLDFFCPYVCENESTLEWFSAYQEINGILEYAQYFFNQEFGYPDRINLISTRLDRSNSEHTRTLQSSVFRVLLRGKQYGILFSLYYLGLKRGQRVNKDGVHLDLGNLKFGLPESLVKRACERLLHHSKDPVPLESISRKSERIESYLRHTLEVYKNLLNKKKRKTMA